MIVSEMIACATGLKELLSSDQKVSNLTASIDRRLEFMTITNIGNAEAYNITVEFKETNWNNPFSDYTFSLSQNEYEEQGLYLNDYDASSAVVELSWTDETQGDLFKSIYFKV